MFVAPGCIGAALASVIVEQVRVAGKDLGAAPVQVALILPERDKAETRAFKRGDELRPGSVVIVPGKTVLVLKTDNGNQITLDPGTRYKVNAATAGGESYGVLAGFAKFEVVRSLGFFNVNYRRFVAVVRGTEFTVAVDPGREIRFELIVGRLLVERPVKLRILEENRVAELAASELLQEGGKTRAAYRLDVDEYLREFRTLRDAEQYYRQQLEQDEKSGDYERVQDGLNALMATRRSSTRLGRCSLGKKRRLASARSSRSVASHL
jgi:hypothetical protein